MTRKSLPAVAVASIMVLGLTACGMDGSSVTGGGDSDTELTIALKIEPSSVEPCDGQVADVGIVLHGNVTESLTDIDATSGEVIPALSTEWEQVDDITWNFTLRDGVTFQDGTEMNADAVVGSLTRLMDESLLCKSHEQFPSPITASTVDDTTVQIVTDGYDPILPLRLSFADIVAPSTPADEKTDHPIGTGPYSFEERVQGQSITLARYDGYWGEKPQATTATFVYRTEPSIRASMIKTGEADVAMSIAPEDATTDGNTLEFSDNRVLWFRMPTDRAPFNDIRVREAAHYAMDKETITSALLENAGEPYDQLLSPSINSYIEGYEGPKFDAEKAKQLLQEAKADGIAIDTEFDLVTRPDIITNGDEVMQAVAQNLQDVGFNVKIRSLDNDAWLKLLRGPFPPDQKPTMIAISHDNITGDASFSYPKYVAGDGVNSTIHSEKIDELLAQAGIAQDEERASLYQQASLEEYENVAAMIPFAQVMSLMTIADGIGYTANPWSNNSLRISEISLP